jgi:DNA-directed RNA polymerase subunit E'
MYYIKTIGEKIRVPPSMFGSQLEDAVLRILRDRFERRIFKDIGIILSIYGPKVLSEGIVIPGDSGAYYTVSFEALTFIPCVNEVFLGEIKEVVEFGAFAAIGPFQGLLHVSQIGRDKFYYDKKSKTLTSRAARKSLKKGDVIIVKVSTVSLKGTTADTKIGLTMRPDGLGKSEWMEKPKKEAVKKKPAKGETR